MLPCRDERSLNASCQESIRSVDSSTQTQASTSGRTTDMAQLWLIIGIAIGALGVWLALHARVEQERESAAERLALVEDARERLNDSFKALAGEALNSNNKAFVGLAKAELAQHQLQAREELEK